MLLLNSSTNFSAFFGATNAITCDFERDKCGWTNENANFQWNSVNLQLVIPDTPLSLYDITTAVGGNGILMVKANDRTTGASVARLISAPVVGQVPKNSKLDFSYHMKGSGNGYLRVLVKENGLSRIVWERNSDQGTEK